METVVTGHRHPGAVFQFTEIINAHWPHVQFLFSPFDHKLAWDVTHALVGINEIAYANITDGYPSVLRFEEGATEIIAPREHVFNLKVAREWYELEDRIDKIIMTRKQAAPEGEFSQHFPLFAQCFDIIMYSDLCRYLSIYYCAKINGHYRKIIHATELEDKNFTGYIVLNRAEKFIARWIATREIIFTLPQPIAEEIFHVYVKHAGQNIHVDN